MKLHTIKPADGAVRDKKRVGRGQGSGRGGTSTRGHKGAKSRSGYKSKLGFEGGQMPLQRRVPKFGFKSPNRIETKPVNLEALQQLAEKTNATSIDINLLIENGIVGKNDIVKILGRGELKTKIDVTAHAFSASAVAAIEKLGGQITKL
jgi:large subunit ribosomal protein L15